MRGAAEPWTIAMQEFLRIFLLCFIPVLVAMDPVGILPIYVSLTEALDEGEKRRVIRQAMLTGLCVALGFMAVGRAVFAILGIEMADFLVAGGIILFCFAIVDLIGAQERRRAAVADTTVGAVPLGTPLMVGPGVLATTLLLLGQHGPWAPALAVAVCLVIVGVVFRGASGLVRILRPAGTRAVSRIVNILLAAYAVMMVRRGLMEIWEMGARG